MPKEVTIRRADLLVAFRRLRLVKSPKKAPDALVSMEGDSLCFSVGGVATYADARGSWSGEVRVPGPFLLALARMPPPGDPIVVVVRDGRFHLGALSVSCVEQDAWQSEIALPLDASIGQVLRVALRHSAERVEKAGLRKSVDDAWQRVAKLIDQAASTLAPLDISKQDLRDMVLAHLKALPDD